MPKDEALTLRVEKPLKDHVEKAARRAGVTRGEYVRRLILADAKGSGK